MTCPRHPTAGFWLTVALVAVLLAYPLSFGPACWLAQRGNLPQSAFIAAYKPCIILANYGPRPLRKVAWWWAKVWRGDFRLEDVSPDGTTHILPRSKGDHGPALLAAVM